MYIVSKDVDHTMFFTFELNEERASYWRGTREQALVLVKMDQAIHLAKSYLSVDEPRVAYVIDISGEEDKVVFSDMSERAKR